MTRVGGGGTSETLIRAGEAPVQAQDVMLCDAGANPAAVADVVRSMTGVDPAAAKELVARVPCAIRTRISPALAEALRARLVAAGGRVEVRVHGAAPAAPERFDVFLQSHGASKINVVRAVKMSLGLGLREAVELVDDAPCLVKRKVEADEAETIRHELLEAGAVVDVRVHDATVPEPPPRASAPVSAPVSVGPGPSSGSFEVILRACGPNKISVIKAIRAATGLGLKEAKDLAESANVTVKRDISEHEARTLLHELKAAGAEVEVRGFEAPEPEPPPAATSAGFDVVIKDCGPRKIHVIKLIRELTTLGLKDAKDMAETPGSTVMAGVGRAEAARIERQFVEAGASVELRAHVDETDATDAAAPQDEPTLVDVFLRSYGTNKIIVIKEVRALTGLGLKDSKDLVEAAPRMVREKVELAVARQFQHLLGEVGAVVELR